jgi:hypothetical protein
MKIKVSKTKTKMLIYVISSYASVGKSMYRISQGLPVAGYDVTSQLV